MGKIIILKKSLSIFMLTILSSLAYVSKFRSESPDFSRLRSITKEESKQTPKDQKLVGLFTDITKNFIHVKAHYFNQLDTDTKILTKQADGTYCLTSLDPNNYPITIEEQSPAFLQIINLGRSQAATPTCSDYSPNELSRTVTPEVFQTPQSIVHQQNPYSVSRFRRR